MVKLLTLIAVILCADTCFAIEHKQPKSRFSCNALRNINNTLESCKNWSSCRLSCYRLTIKDERFKKLFGESCFFDVDETPYVIMKTRMLSDHIKKDFSSQCKF
ncbi:MAG: hypothetical protein CMF41_01975 [Legionellales bacterium]|nr:hypothetical protein [Legionellales bacterium]OUX65839.1 MAG: hypothetical protein CBE41_01170 [Gammaproteobacteria bacterium TMED281]